jgi:hypothetical protein
MDLKEEGSITTVFEVNAFHAHKLTASWLICCSPSMELYFRLSLKMIFLRLSLSLRALRERLAFHAKTAKSSQSRKEMFLKLRHYSISSLVSFFMFLRTVNETVFAISL